MEQTIEDICICFWKISYTAEKEKGNKLGKTFENCVLCDGNKYDCHHYFNPKKYLDYIKEKK